jgi:organic radical activating enzyme
MIVGRITEVFESIQGEGLYLGERQIFVRFHGCNLKCKFCDTQPSSFMEYTPHELFKEITMHHDDHHSVSFTGGEPLLQKYFLKEILKLTHENSLRNYLETNGTLHEELRSVIDYVHYVAMDLKLPSSTGLNDFWDDHRLFLEIASQKECFLKVVVLPSTHEDDLRTGLRLIRETAKDAVLILQPDSGNNNVSLGRKLDNFKDICRRERVTACIIPQVHKITGVR